MPKFREAYRSIELYDPKRTPCATDLSDNTNLFGVAPSVQQLFVTAPPHLITRYPTVFAPGLKQLLAIKHRVDPENITTGCGSDDVIDSALRAFCEPGDRVAFPNPTFGIVPTFVHMNAATPESTTYNADFSIDVPALVRSHAAATYVCNPNNPTGTTVTARTIEELDASVEGILLLDEAYADFSDADYAVFAAQSQRTISLRTMSKACGLAGLRVGYAIGPAPMIREVEKSRGPYKVNAVAEAAASGIISADSGWVADVIAQTRANRERLGGELDKLGLKYLKSAANFILIQLPPPLTAHEANTEFRARGVAVRPFANLPHAGECVRVTIGPWAMMQTFLATAEQVLKAT